MSSTGSCPPGVLAGREFRTTCWNLIEMAAHGEDTRAALARESLCCNYWYPLYSYLRRCGHSPEDARDLVQGFLGNLFGKHELRVAAPSRGRFRSFLLGALKHHVADERKRANAQKRGGGLIPVSLDAEDAESRFLSEGAVTDSPEVQYDRQWALQILDVAERRLRAIYASRGEGRTFEVLFSRLGGGDDPEPIAVTARRLGMSEPSVKTAIHRLKRRYGDVLRAEVQATVADPSEVPDELRHLLKVAVT